MVVLPLTWEVRREGERQLKKLTVGKIIREINLRCLRFISSMNIKNSPMQQIQFSC